MAQSISALNAHLGKIRTGRANPALLDTVMVDYYGNPTPLNQVANVSLLDARTISVQPWEKGMGAKIEKAIRESDLGVNPVGDGNVIRVNFPQWTEERRKEFIKGAKGKAEESRVSIRAIRRHSKEAMEKLEKDGVIGKDDLTRGEKDLEKTTSDHVTKIDELLKHKEAELLEV